jgi:hypothetical protein
MKREWEFHGRLLLFLILAALVVGYGLSVLRR